MKRGPHKFLLAIFFICFSFGSMAQMNRIREANKLYNKMAYYFAAEAYEDVLARGIDSTSIATNIADCYDKIENNVKAVAWYEHIERRSILNKNQLLRYAMVLRQTKSYDLSLQKFIEYEKRFGATELTTRRIAEHYLLEYYNKDGGSFEVVNQSLANTESSDIGVSWYKSGQVFVSNATRSNYLSNRTYDRMGNKFYGLYVSNRQDDGALSKPDRLKGNTRFHDGPAIYDPNNNVIYFTRSNYIGGKKKFDASSIMRLKILRAEVNSKGKIVNITELAINSDVFSTGHPAISSDGKTLYFTSDRIGGFGGTDLWKVSIDAQGQTGAPVNLGATINTTQNEMFPYVDSESNMLFFASDGHTGLGGLDVFFAYFNADETRVSGLTNMGAPINSEYDDFGYIIDKALEQGYFISNRPEGKGDDDIYSFKMLNRFEPMLSVEGLVTECETSSFLPGSKVLLKDTFGYEITSSVVGEDGYFKFMLNPSLQQEYVLEGTLKGYEKVKINFQTVKMTEEYHVIRQDFCLKKLGLEPEERNELALHVLVIDKQTKKPIEGAQVIIADDVLRRTMVSGQTSEQGEYYTPILNKRILDDLIYRIRADKSGYSGKVVDYAGVYQSNSVIHVVIELDKGLFQTPGQEIIDCFDNRVVLNPIYFDLDKHHIRPDAAVELDKIVALLNRCQNMVMEIGSHTDCRASYTYNDALSRRRAQSSINYIKKRIVNPSRVKSKGYGEKQLVEPCPCEPSNESDCTEEQHQLNRRTEFRILSVGRVNSNNSQAVAPTPQPISSSPNTSSPNTSSSYDGGETYTIKEGETLYRVYVYTGVSVNEIKRLNNLKSNTVHVGQVLRVRYLFL